jgi:hypothetical protein
MATKNLSDNAQTRALNNRYLLDRIRRQLIARQPGNEVFKSIVENLSSEDLLRHWMTAQKTQTRKPVKKIIEVIVWDNK